MKLRLSQPKRMRLEEIAVDRHKPQARRRALAILLRARGQSVVDIARELGLNRATIHRWIEAFRKVGLTSVEASRPRGRPAEYPRRRIVRLFEQSRKKSARGLGWGNEWNARKFVRFAQLKWREGAEGMTIKKMRRLLREAGFVHNGTTWERQPADKLRVKARRYDAQKAAGKLPKRHERL